MQERTAKQCSPVGERRRSRKWRDGCRRSNDTQSTEQQGIQNTHRNADRWALTEAWVFFLRSCFSNLKNQDTWEKVSESWDSPRKSKLMVITPISHICHLAGQGYTLSGKEKIFFTCNTKVMFNFPVLHSISTIKTQLNNYCLKFPCGLSKRSGQFPISNFSCCFTAAKRLPPSLRYRPVGQGCLQSFLGHSDMLMLSIDQPWLAGSS